MIIIFSIKKDIRECKKNKRKWSIAHSDPKYYQNRGQGNNHLDLFLTSSNKTNLIWVAETCTRKVCIKNIANKLGSARLIRKKNKKLKSLQLKNSYPKSLKNILLTNKKDPGLNHQVYPLALIQKDLTIDLKDNCHLDH